jgi:hypothetical protein
MRRTRVDCLAARVRWLDRFRRSVAIASACLIAPILIAQVADVPDTDWSVMSFILGAITWWVIEVGLVYVTAVWEAEHDGLVRDRSLPRAVLLRPRSRR